MQPLFRRRSKGEDGYLRKLRKLGAVSFNLHPTAFHFPFTCIFHLQQVLVILLYCPVAYAELVLFYRVLLMDWINGNAI